MTRASAPVDMRKLAAFLVVSMLLHAWVMYGAPFRIFPSPSERQPLSVRLAPSPALPPVPRRALPQSRHEPAAEASSSSSTVAPVPDGMPTAAGGVEVSPATPQTQADTGPPVAESVAAASVPAAQLARRLPRKGEITYELYLGNDKFNVGRTRQNWEIDGEQYRLSSVSETTGLAALFVRQRLAYESRGVFYSGGLRPRHFTTERLRAGRSESAAADFDWAAMTITVGNPQRTVEMSAEAQDMVSFMYQLGLRPLEPGRIAMPVTNGWKLERYELDIGAEQFLQTPFGGLRAVPVRQVARPGEESIELWLAPAYRWLPVRIRFFNRDGEPSGEQVVSDIRVSED